MSQKHALSRHGIPVRLTDERWEHIMEEHAELVGLRQDVLQAVSEAERVLKGMSGELLAVRMMEPGKAIVVVYRETNSEDGFIITAFLTRRLDSLNRREQVWPLQV